MLLCCVCDECACFVCRCYLVVFFFFKQKTAYEMRISDWSSDVCSSDLGRAFLTCTGISGPMHVPRSSSARICAPVPAQSIFFISTAMKWISPRSEEHTSELQSLMRISYAVFCLKKKKLTNKHNKKIKTT